MTTLETLLTSRSSFELAALVVTWIAVAGLVIMVGHLHARVQRLERAHAPAHQPAPYNELVGRPLAELLGDSTALPAPRLALFLSTTCRACAPLLAELHDPAWARLPSAIVWIDAGTPATPAPAHVRITVDGPRVAARLGIRVTPFALVAAADGHVIHAAPVNSLRALDSVAGTRPAGARTSAPVAREVVRESGV